MGKGEDKDRTQLPAPLAQLSWLATGWWTMIYAVLYVVLLIQASERDLGPGNVDFFGPGELASSH